MAKVACVLGKDFEDVEFRQPCDSLQQAGHSVDTVGKKAGQIVAGKRGQEKVRVEHAAADCSAEEYDLLLIPGGYSPDQLRTDGSVVEFVRKMVAAGKPVAAVCHGPQLLIEAEVVRGVRMTSWPSVRKDLQNAGAKVVDERVVEDGQFITSRGPDDLEAFSEAILDVLSELEQAGGRGPQEEPRPTV